MIFFILNTFIIGTGQPLPATSQLLTKKLHVQLSISKLFMYLFIAFKTTYRIGVLQLPREGVPQWNNSVNMVKVTLLKHYVLTIFYA